MDGRHRPDVTPSRQSYSDNRFRALVIAGVAVATALSAASWLAQTHHSTTAERLGWTLLGAAVACLLALCLLRTTVPIQLPRRHLDGQPATVNATTPGKERDAVTRLPTRRSFACELEELLEHTAANRSRRHVVLVCDVDDFKAVNESLGHRVGDNVLSVIAARIAATVRASDTIARLGDDEFAVLMRDTDLPAAHLVAQRLQAKFAEAVVVEDRSLTIGASIGLAEVVAGDVTSEEALRNADLAMYQTKTQGKAGIAWYESEMHTQIVDRLTLTEDLRRALDDGQFVLHYQPTVDLKSHDLVGFEALVRWQHPERGMLSPGSFISLAEESDLIVEIGRWVLRTACRVAAAMQTGRSRPVMSVNVAARQLAQPGFVGDVVGILAETGLPSDRLCLEITESVVLTDLKILTDRLLAIRDLGVRIAIDDFGTGYSSLAYLSRLPVDVLKVDKSFVDRVMINEQDATLTMAIIAMGRTMNLTTVAEGVESTDQAAWLAHAECAYGQGYLWSPPVTVADAHDLLGNPEMIENAQLSARF
jgi:diguanylate cyclase (GGDEF)-like protein